MTQFKDIEDCQFFTTGGLEVKRLWYKRSKEEADCLGIMLGRPLGGPLKFRQTADVKPLEIGR